MSGIAKGEGNEAWEGSGFGVPERKKTKTKSKQPQKQKSKGKTMAKAKSNGWCGGVLGGEGRSGVDKKDRTMIRKETRSMRNHFLLISLLAALGATAGAAGAAPYWYAYEGNDFPENEGWTREINAAGGANRWIEDGALVIDSRHNAGIIDDYFIEGIEDPGPNEQFVAEWRVFSEEMFLWYDAGVVIARTGTPGHVRFHLGVEDVLVRREWETIPISPGEWHAYRIESEDMVHYTMTINGEQVFSGMFEDQSALESFMLWGDTLNGAASLTRWDYVRFGVVPEPCSISLFLVLYGCGVRGRGSSALRAGVEDWGRHQGLKSLATVVRPAGERRNRQKQWV